MLLLLLLLLLTLAAATRVATGSPPDDDALRRKFYTLLYRLPGLPVVHRYVRQGFDPSGDDDRDAAEWATHPLAPPRPASSASPPLANRDPKRW